MQPRKMPRLQCPACATQAPAGVEQSTVTESRWMWSHFASERAKEAKDEMGKHKLQSDHFVFGIIANRIIIRKDAAEAQNRKTKPVHSDDEEEAVEKEELHKEPDKKSTAAQSHEGEEAELHKESDSKPKGERNSDDDADDRTKPQPKEMSDASKKRSYAADGDSQRPKKKPRSEPPKPKVIKLYKDDGIVHVQLPPPSGTVKEMGSNRSRIKAALAEKSAQAKGSVHFKESQHYETDIQMLERATKVFAALLGPDGTDVIQGYCSKPVLCKFCARIVVIRWGQGYTREKPFRQHANTVLAKKLRSHERSCHDNPKFAQERANFIRTRRERRQKQRAQAKNPPAPSQ